LGGSTVLHQHQQHQAQGRSTEHTLKAHAPTIVAKVQHGAAQDASRLAPAHSSNARQQQI
jgi:hypothetical protein